MSTVAKFQFDTLRPKTILIVDEEPASRSNVVQLLKDEGYEVHLADNGQAAIDLIDRIAFAVVITSLRLNGDVSGIDILMHHELVSPGAGKILMTDFISKKVQYVANFLSAMCVPTEIPANALLDSIKSPLRS